MDWEDTVMSDEQLTKITYSRIPGRYKEVAQAQAEISVKAGIREVMEWVEQGNYIGEDGVDIKDAFVIGGKAWRAQVKSWNVQKEGE